MPDGNTESPVIPRDRTRGRDFWGGMNRRADKERRTPVRRPQTRAAPLLDSRGRGGGMWTSPLLAHATPNGFGKPVGSSAAECNGVEGPPPLEDRAVPGNPRSLDFILVAQAPSIPLGMTALLPVHPQSGRQRRRNVELDAVLAFARSPRPGLLYSTPVRCCRRDTMYSPLPPSGYALLTRCGHYHRLPSVKTHWHSRC